LQAEEAVGILTQAAEELAVIELAQELQEQIQPLNHLIQYNWECSTL
jgi:hypothetical protein